MDTTKIAIVIIPPFVLLTIILLLWNPATKPPSNGPTYNALIEVSSPIQNKTYFTNNIPLSFNYSTNIPDLPNITEYSVVFEYNLVNREPDFDVLGKPIFWGKTTTIGQFYQPIPLDYNSSIHIPDGNYTLSIHLTFWITPEGENQNVFGVRKVSQEINFTVSSPTP